MATHPLTLPATTSSTVNATAIDPRIERWMDRLASTVIGRYGFVEADRDDLQQEMRLALLEAQATYRSDRSRWHTFANRIIKARLTDLIRERTSRKRGSGVLHPPANSSGEAVIDEGVFLDDPRIEPGDPTGEIHLHRVALAMDIPQVLARLPVELRRIAERLMVSEPKDAWRELGMRKSTFYEALGRLRMAFAKAGLDPAAN